VSEHTPDVLSERAKPPRRRPGPQPKYAPPTSAQVAFDNLRLLGSEKWHDLIRRSTRALMAGGVMARVPRLLAAKAHLDDALKELHLLDTELGPPEAHPKGSSLLGGEPQPGEVQPENPRAYIELEAKKHIVQGALALTLGIATAEKESQRLVSGHRSRRPKDTPRFDALHAEMEPALATSVADLPWVQPQDLVQLAVHWGIDQPLPPPGPGPRGRDVTQAETTRRSKKWEKRLKTARKELGETAVR
jgi:hypothetical protein